MSLCLLVFYVMMEPDIENMTFNKYLMYKGRNRDLTRNCTSRNRGACFKVAPVRSRILVYPNSNKEEEEYYRLPPLLLCFQTPQPCTKFNSIPHNDVDIDSMTLDEYDLYMAMQSPATDPILDEFLEEVRDVLLNIIPDDEEADCNPTRDIEELERLLKPSRDFTRPLGPPSGLRGLLHTLNATVIPKKVEARGVMLGCHLATRKHFKSGLVECHTDDNVELPVIVDVAR
ncbi:hypothetical protein Tco_0720193 [Tanacetum coccineum]